MKERIGGPDTPPQGMESLMQETTFYSKPPCYGRPTETVRRENGIATVRCRLCGNVWDELV
jgi:hypothetical protein